MNYETLLIVIGLRFNGTVVNPTYHSKNERFHKITLKVP